jgi:hypothetical protein
MRIWSYDGFALGEARRLRLAVGHGVRLAGARRDPQLPTGVGLAYRPSRTSS